MFANFMIHTWIVATLVAIVAGMVGFLVVMRGATFAAHALPMCAFSGAAASSLFGIHPFYGVLAFSGLGAAGVGHLGQRARHEVATALTLVTLLGLGTLFLSMTSNYSQEVYALLFGQVFGVNTAQVLAVAIAGAIAVAVTVVLFRPFLLSAVSAELGEIQGVSARRMELCFLAVLALATATALSVVGALLVFTLMIAPPAMARSLSSQPMRAMCYSAGIALAIVWTAIALSYLTNWPLGFFVGVLGAVLYALERAATTIRAVTRAVSAG